MTAPDSPPESRGDQLEPYRSKRDFSRTGEPRGDGRGVEGGARFVIQKHAARQLHYDLRLELDGVLKSWAVPKGPSLDPAQKVLAVQVEDHPLEYADFEGVIPEGEYGGGAVMLWDIGIWAPLEDDDDGYARGDFKFRLHGQKLRGAWVLVRMRGEKSSGRDWLLLKKKDEAARPIAAWNVLAELPLSVHSGRTMEQIAEDADAIWSGGAARPAAVGGRRHGGPDASRLPGAAASALPRTFRPQLATPVTTPPESAAWIHEVKLDGYRLLCRIERGREKGAVRLLTRNGHDWTDALPVVAEIAARLPVDDAMLDGELVAIGAEGRPDFGALQRAFRIGAPYPLVYYLFDVPFANGHDLTRVPLIERKAFLAAMLDAAPMCAPTIQLCEHFEGPGSTVFAQAAALGLEGIISKRRDAPYVSRRTDAWLKIKNKCRQEFVVVGYTDPAGARRGFGALVVGYHDDEGALVYCGRVGSGFSGSMLEILAQDLDALAIETPALQGIDGDPELASARWVRPEIVVEVEFLEWTVDGLLRQPVFRGVRSDREATDVQREPVAAGAEAAIVVAPRSPDEVDVGGVRLSHPHRPVYPEARFTKADVARYIEGIVDRLWPHVERRPLSIVRCPLGLAGDAFFQRHLGDGFPKGIRGTPVGTKAEGEPYLYVESVQGLVGLVQMGVLEIHTWGCRLDALERPDQLVFDLDPGEGITWPDVVASARYLRDYLEDAGLRSFVKTTGGRGAHVVVPLVRRQTWDTAHGFARAVARDLARIAPRNFVATVSKDLRKHRIYVDYLRNVRGATAVAPYSMRARPGGCVSMPLSWDELSGDVPPSAWTVKSVLERVDDADPWASFRELRQSLTKAVCAKVGG